MSNGIKAWAWIPKAEQITGIAKKSLDSERKGKIPVLRQNKNPVCIEALLDTDSKSWWLRIGVSARGMNAEGGRNQEISRLSVVLPSDLRDLLKFLWDSIPFKVS